MAPLIDPEKCQQFLDKLICPGVETTTGAIREYLGGTHK